MLNVRNITKVFDGFALRDVSFEVAQGEYFVLLGPSGVGKTMILEIIAGLQVPDSGSIYLDGKDITAERIQRRRCALVYQDRSLFPHMSVRRNIAYGLRAGRMHRAAVKERIGKLADDIDIRDILDRDPRVLSGGEVQRVALARALATEPRCLLLDEPISSLDAGSRRQLQSLLRSLNRQGHTMLHVTHDYEEAITLASRVAIMNEGRIVQIGEPAEVFRHPKSAFVAGFIGIRNFFKGHLRYTDGQKGLAEVVTSGPVFRVLSDERPGDGHLMVRSEDVIVSEMKPQTSAQNTFEGVIADVVPAKLGMEIAVDIGVEILSAVSRESVKSLSLARGQRIWISFKASAAKFLRE